MKTTTCALTLALSCAALAPAADPNPPKPVDTSFLKKFAETRRFMLGRPQNPKVSPDGKSVLFLRAEADKPTLKLFEFDVASGQSKELLSPATLLKGGEENLSPEEKARRERMRLSAGGFADFHFDKDGRNVLLPLSGKLFVFERASGKVTELKTGEGSIVDPKWSPDGTKVAYVRGYDVYVIDLATNKESAVTKGGTITKTHGLAEFVAQEEMGRFTGYWWSPDSKSIAYEEADHAGVETWYVADPFKPDQKPAEQFYPRPGKKNVGVRLGIVPLEGGETVWVDLTKPISKAGGRTFEYLAAVRWGANGPLTLVLQDRLQRDPAYLEVDPKTGEASAFHLILQQDAWTNLRPDEPRWQPDGRFLLGYDDGGADGVILKRSRALPTIVVSPDDKHGGIEILGATDTHLIYSAHTADTPERHVFRVSLKSVTDRKLGDAPVRLTTAGGVHSAVLSKDGKLAVITSTSPGRMPHTDVVAVGGLKVGTLPSVAVEPDFKPNVKIEKLGDFWTAIVRPRDFDPKKKYPVIVDVYGGPRHLHVVQAMRNWLVPQWLADQGFIVVAIDNRGTPGRGREWEKAIYQKFGTVPLEDQVKGLQLLCAKFPELDRDRVGIVGWSFGGYMAANGVLRAPEVFKAAVAGAPVTDWEDYDTHYTERYMGLLPESRKAYDDASLLPLAKNLKRPLLLVHGTADDNVYYRHTLKLADALFRAGKDFESLPLPGVTHMYTSDPAVMERLWARTAGFFKTHLGESK